jgi:hypothetical protein
MPSGTANDCPGQHLFGVWSLDDDSMLVPVAEEYLVGFLYTKHDQQPVIARNFNIL